jgi:hypothetical protein
MLFSCFPVNKPSFPHWYTFDFYHKRWSWSYGSWIYNYLGNQCLSPLRLCARYNICQWVASGQWLSPGAPLSPNKIKTPHHDITEILLKVALNSITLICKTLISCCITYCLSFFDLRLLQTFLTYVWVR